ncbi:hypothetical protein IYW40_04970 [Methylocystis sp. H4A]|uniref:hypothetical protein n=1 Tax=Methylocystis sp. H4A TaxID=2785788 RepID=UPI0018C342B6|nr:hypothetical protein [Methylocystis sp. H4A]MBG0800842.1 hypothetical protein [Methylocystis sp. H4A]
MPTLQLLGRVVPSTIQADITDLPSLNWKSDRSDLSGTFSYNCKSSNIHLIANLDRHPTYEEQAFVISVLLDGIQTLIDMIAFRENIYATVIIEKMIDIDGTESTLIFRLNEFMSLKSMRPERFGDMVNILFNDLPAAIALHDVITSLYRRHLSVTLCARAVEAIRNNIASGIKREKQWPIMRAALKLDETYVNYITDASKAPRHGDHAFIPGDIAREVQSRTFIIMDRFLEYKLRGSTPLPEDEFQTLR